MSQMFTCCVRLKSIHQPDTEETSVEITEVPISNANRKLDIYINDASFSAVLALTALGHSVPNLVVGIRVQVLRYGNQLQEEVSRFEQY